MLQDGPACEGEYVKGCSAGTHDAQGEEFFYLSEAHYKEPTEKAESEVNSHIALNASDFSSGHPYYGPDNGNKL